MPRRSRVFRSLQLGYSLVFGLLLRKAGAQSREPTKQGPRTTNQRQKTTDYGQRIKDNSRVSMLLIQEP